MVAENGVAAERKPGVIAAAADTSDEAAVRSSNSSRATRQTPGRQQRPTGVTKPSDCASWFSSRLFSLVCLHVGVARYG